MLTRRFRRRRTPQTALETSAILLALIALQPVRVTAQSLAGTWRVTMQLDSAWSTPHRPVAHILTGSLSIKPAPAAMPGDSMPPVHLGHFSLRFRRFGFRVYGPTLFAVATRGDSVRIILNPTVDHGHVQLMGARAGNRITGTWLLVSDPMGARGRFTLVPAR